MAAAGSVDDESLRRRRMVPDALTLARPVIGAAAALALVADAGALAGWLFLAGYLTDVFDGLAARALHVAGEHGTRLDGICDLVFMYAIGIGLAARGALDGAWWVPALVVVGAVGGHVLDRRLPAHTVLGKVEGGLARLGLFALFVWFCPPDQRVPLAVTSAVVVVVTYAYEAVVTLADLRSGERPVR